MKKFFIGVDVSKDTVDVSFFDDDRMKSPEYLAQYSNSPKGFREMVKDLRMCCHGVSSGQWLFCCETTGRYDHPLCHWLVTTAWWYGERAPSKSSGRPVFRGARTTGWTRCESPSTPGATRTRCRSS